MNKHLKEFLHRGLMFGGFGPIVGGIVFAILGATIEDFHIEGWQILLAIVSTYLLAFVQAGATVFNQIEKWGIAKSLACHFGSIYAVYLLAYAVNSWIPFEPIVVVIFTALFAVTYVVIWLTVFLVIRATEKKLNKKIKKI